MFLSSLNLLAICLAALPAVTAQIALPPILGNYSVGTKRVELIDYSREDPFAPTPQPRAFMAQFWYPISVNSSIEPATWLPANASVYAAAAGGIPVEGVLSINTRTYVNGTILTPLVSNSSLPILVFSPGLGAPAALYTSFLSSIAARGYLVIGVDHPYDSDFVELASGEVILSTVTAANITLAVTVRTGDVLYLASQLTMTNLTEWIPSLWCPSCIPTASIFGHSTGGNTAVQAMAPSNITHRPSPYKSSASLDGIFVSSTLTTGFPGPFLYIAAENSTFHSQLVAQWPLIKPWKLAVQVNGTKHQSFTDLAVIVPQVPNTTFAALYSSELGTINSNRTILITDTYLEAFFQWSLLGKSRPAILDGEVGQFQEVSFLDLGP
jgi:hypothetical protein